MLEIKISSKCHNEKSCEHDSFFRQLMAKMPYTMECLGLPIRRFKSCKYTFLKKTFFSANISSTLILFSLLGPPHPMLLSPLSNSRSVSLNDTRKTVRFRLWQFYKLVFFAFKTQPKTPECFYIFVSKFEIWFTPGDAKDLRVGSASRLSAIDSVECFIHALNLGSENVNGDRLVDFWQILLVILNEHLGEAFNFGMNIQRCYTRLQDISAVCENPVYVLLV